MAQNLHCTCRLPPDLNYFSFSFINNTVGVWGARFPHAFSLMADTGWQLRERWFSVHNNHP